MPETPENTPQEAAQSDLPAPEPTEAHTDATDAPEAAEEPTGEPEKPRNREAGYRVRAKEAEAQLEATNAQLDALRGQLVNSALEGVFKVPAEKNGRTWERNVQLHDVEDALTLAGIDKAAYFTDGTFDKGALLRDIGKLHETKPQLFVQLNRPVSTAGKVPESVGSRTAIEEAFLPPELRGRG